MRTDTMPGRVGAYPRILGTGRGSSTQRGKGRAGGVEAAHPVHAGTGWRGGRAEVHAGHARVVRVAGDPWTQQELSRVVGAGGDVTADIVGVVRGQVARRAGDPAPDPLPYRRGEPFDLVQDRLGRVAGVARRHVRVRPHRVYVA